MFIRSLLVILISLALASCASMRIPQQLEQGKLDFSQANYKQAFRGLLPIATEGNAEAEYAVGYMYYYGLGAPLDAETGIFWMQKAADQKNENALNALKMIKQ